MGYAPAYPKTKRLRGGHARTANYITPSATPVATARDRFTAFSEEEAGVGLTEALNHVSLKPVPGSPAGMVKQYQKESPPKSAADSVNLHHVTAEEVRQTQAQRDANMEEDEASRLDEEQGFHEAATGLQKIILGKQARRASADTSAASAPEQVKAEFRASSFTREVISDVVGDKPPPPAPPAPDDPISRCLACFKPLLDAAQGAPASVEGGGSAPPSAPRASGGQGAASPDNFRASGFTRGAIGAGVEGSSAGAAAPPKDNFRA